MGLDKEAMEFNEKQKRLQEYYQTEGRHLSRVEDELHKLNISLGFLIDTIMKWIEDEDRRRKEDRKRSTYGIWDSQQNRTQRDRPDDYGYNYDYLANTKPYRAPVWPKGQPGSNRGSPRRSGGPRNEPVPPSDRDPFDEGTEDGKASN